MSIAATHVILSHADICGRTGHHY